MSRDLHIVSFDVPFPADYGGVIDVFYKLKALHAEKINIHLHCFEYGRKPQKELNKYCKTVNYYPRQTNKSLLFNTLPYIVLTRNSDQLKENLLKDDFPILMEGLHSTFLLNDKQFSERKIFVRMHNVEHEYYENLANVENNIFKRYYFYNEAGKLKKYESVLKKTAGIAAISPSDTKHFSSSFNNVNYIPAFHPFDKVKILPGKSDFAFYHGNLSVGENNEGALYLVKEIFNDLPYKLIIAGNKPSDELKKAVKTNSNVQLHSDLSPEEIQKMIQKAQCNVLPTFQSTGIKLKLLAALFSGRYCIVNEPMVVNTGLESLCMIGNTAAEMKSLIHKAMDNENFPAEETEMRKQILSRCFNSQLNSRKLINMIFGNITNELIVL